MSGKASNAPHALQQTVMAAFIALPALGAHALQRRPARRVRQAQRNLRVMCASSATTAGFPACFPAAAAALITDPTAISMMREATETYVQTPLSPAPIDTVHVRGGAGVPGTAPAVILLHGFDSNCLEYRRLRAALADAPLVCYFVDILGWGFTAKPEGISYGVDAKRAHLHAWRQSVIGSGEPVVVAGSSIGGAVALDYALTYPDGVAGLVLIDAQAYTDKEEAPLFKSLPVLARLGANVLRSRWLRQLAIRLSYESAALKCEDTLAIGGLHCLTEGWLEAAVDFIQGKGYCLSKRVAETSCPALVLYGMQDRIIPSAENAVRFEKDLANYGCVVIAIDNCGHSPHIEHPVEVASHVLNFVSELSGLPQPASPDISRHAQRT
jgi:pimeloyl-ACP methyl ester carboxylesterase